MYCSGRGTDRRYIHYQSSTLATTALSMPWRRGQTFSLLRRAGTARIKHGALYSARRKKTALRAWAARERRCCRAALQRAFFNSTFSYTWRLLQGGRRQGARGANFFLHMPLSATVLSRISWLDALLLCVFKKKRLPWAHPAAPVITLLSSDRWASLSLGIHACGFGLPSTALLPRRRSAGFPCGDRSCTEAELQRFSSAGMSL